MKLIDYEDIFGARTVFVLSLRSYHRSPFSYSLHPFCRYAQFMSIHFLLVLVVWTMSRTRTGRKTAKESSLLLMLLSMLWSIKEDVTFLFMSTVIYSLGRRELPWWTGPTSSNILSTSESSSDLHSHFQPEGMHMPRYQTLMFLSFQIFDIGQEQRMKFWSESIYIWTSFFVLQYRILTVHHIVNNGQQWFISGDSD